MDSIYTPIPPEGEDARFALEKQLARRLSRDFDFGLHADSELYSDLARAFLRCRMRSASRGLRSSSYNNLDPAAFTVSPKITTNNGEERKMTECLQPLNARSDDWDLSMDEETEEEEGKENTDRNNHTKSSSADPGENSVTKSQQCGMGSLESLRSPSTSSLLEEEEEVEGEIMEELQRINLDRINATSPDLDTNNKDKSQVSLNLLKDFELMGMQNEGAGVGSLDEDPTNEYDKGVVMGDSGSPSQASTYALNSRQHNDSESEVIEGQSSGFSYHSKKASHLSDESKEKDSSTGPDIQDSENNSAQTESIEGSQLPKKNSNIHTPSQNSSSYKEGGSDEAPSRDSKDNSFSPLRKILTDVDQKESNSMDCGLDHSDNSKQDTSKSSSYYLTDQEDMNSPLSSQSKPSSSPPSPTLDVNFYTSNSSFKYANPSNIPQFEMGAGSNGRSAFKRNKGRRKTFPTNHGPVMPPPPPPPPITKQSNTEDLSNNDLIFNTERAPAVKFNVDLKSGMHKANGTATRHKFGKRLYDSKKNSISKAKIGTRVTMSSFSASATIDHLSDETVGEDDMDVDDLAQSPSSKVDEGKDRDMTADIGSKGFTIGIGGFSSGKTSKPRNVKKTWIRHQQPPGISRMASSDSLWSSNSTVSSQKGVEVDELVLARERKVFLLREEAKTLYNGRKYKESVLKYTAAIVTNTIKFTSFPDPMKCSKSHALLVSLYGNRAAALMMIGAYDVAASDCQKAIDLLKQHPLLNLTDKQQLPALKGDGKLTLMTKLLTRKGRAYMKLGIIIEAGKAFDNAIETAQSALLYNKEIRDIHAKNGTSVPVEVQTQSDNFLNRCITDATLNKLELNRMEESIESISNDGGVRSDIDVPLAKLKNRQLFECVNSVLSSAPAHAEFQGFKVFCLASMRKWIKLASFCEQLACNNVEFDGVFTEDLAEYNPFPSVQAVEHIHSDIFANEGTYDTKLTPKQVAEAILRLPNNIVEIYVRSLRLQERYVEAGKAIGAMASFVERTGHSWSPIRQRQKPRCYWLASERDKLRRTIENKDKGDSYYKNSEYRRAAENYATVLKIDGEGYRFADFSCDPWDFKTSGGRLHAVLHCNRAACFMALKQFQIAAKECTAALRIEEHYMKAMLRRARCNVRLGRYEESIADYERWSKLVEDSRNNSCPKVNMCDFDRASHVSDRDYQKTCGELAEAKNLKRQTDMKTQAAASANARRQEWYDQRGAAGSRRWDSFGGTSPLKNSKRAGSKRFSSTGNRKERKKESPSSSSVICHYDILQITTLASQADIKKAYRKMALKYHPDKNSSASAAEVFRKVKLAYETLSDEKARRKYDIVGLCQHRS